MSAFAVSGTRQRRHIKALRPVFLRRKVASGGGGDGKVRLWLVDEQKLIAALCPRAGRNLTKDEGPATSVPTLPRSRAVATAPRIDERPTRNHGTSRTGP